MKVKFNFNGNIFDESENFFEINNRAFVFGDYITEPIKVSNQETPLLEEHYFNLMASMRIFRMKIPQSFTQEFFLKEIQKTCQANNVDNGRFELIIYRNADSEQMITKSTVSFIIRITEIFENSNYIWDNQKAEIEIFKDFTIYPNFFSQINSHKPELNIAMAYMQENDYQDLVLLNTEKKIAKSLLGSLFLINENKIKTPKITEGGIRSVLRNHLCKILSKSTEFDFEETEIFPFELQKSEELFICIEGFGLKSIHQNRKKTYSTDQTKNIVELLNS